MAHRSRAQPCSLLRRLVERFREHTNLAPCCTLCTAVRANSPPPVPTMSGRHQHMSSVTSQEKYRRRLRCHFTLPQKKSPRVFSPGRSVACLCVEERLIFLIRGPGVRFRVQLVRTHAFFESLAYLLQPFGRLRPLLLVVIAMAVPEPAAPLPM